MKQTLATLLTCAVCFAVLTAQTPEPAPSATPGKPIRHLVYAFSADYQGLTGHQYNGLHSGTSGVAIGAPTAGRRGTISVDVMSVAPDGALVIAVSEWLRYQPRPGQTYTCTVYGNTGVLCPMFPEPTDAERSLLSYLGREFVTAAPWNANHQWSHKESTKLYDLTETFTMSDPGTGSDVVVTEVKDRKLHDVRFEDRIHHVRIVYDRAMEIPDRILDVMDTTGTGVSAHSVFKFRLEQDSFSKSGALGSPAPTPS
jgi:hypothetical protein